MAGTLMMVACVAPKATLVAEVPVKKKLERKEKPAVAEVTELPTTGLPDDGIRMPEMLDLPSEGDFRASNPGLSKPTGQGGAVVSRPPTDPPSRVKPPAAGTE